MKNLWNMAEVNRFYWYWFPGSDIVIQVFLGKIGELCNLSLL